MKIIFVVGLIIALSTSAFAAEPIKTSSSSQKVLSSENGRFVLGQLSDMRADRFLLDTQTGRVWQLVSYTPTDKDGKPSGSQRQVLQTTMFIDNLDRTSALPISDVSPDELSKAFSGSVNKNK